MALPASCRALLVGGGRGMGAWLARMLRDKAVDCCICDTHLPSVQEMKQAGYVATHYAGEAATDFLDATGQLPFDLLLLAVPIAQMEKVAAVFCPHCRSGTLVMDVCSTKVAPLATMERHTPSNCEVLGTHPLFGPKIYPPFSQTWILTPSSTHRPVIWEPRVRHLIEDVGALVYRTTASAHDEAMQVVQVGTHLTLLVFGTFLAHAQRSLNELQNFKTPIFELLASLATRVYAQNPALYFGIQKQPHADATQALFSEAISKVQSLLAAADLDDFIAHHGNVKRWMGETNVVALDHVINSAIRALADERKLIRAHLGKAICLKNLETGKIHHGILEAVEPPSIRVRKRKETVSLSLKKVALLSISDKYEWLMKTGGALDTLVSYHAPRTADGGTIAGLVGTLPGVVRAHVCDEYVPDERVSEIKHTLRLLLDPDVLGEGVIKAVRDLLVGLGYKPL